MDYYKLKVLNNKKKIIITICLLIVGIVICYYFLIYRASDNNKEILSDIIEVNNDITPSRDIYVDIKGFVNKPGVYSFNLSDNARINDLINKAGGLMKEADTSTINLSKKLEDEMTVIIYSKNEVINFVKTKDEISKKLEICENKLKNNACIKPQEESSNNKININEASESELLKLNGIGEAKAKLIIEYREKTKFKSIEEIKNVEGIGENLYNAIKDNITV